jgi:prepilin-type N-terminal cleavage/methylation domain-containing protein
MKKGLTLVELIVTMVILAILSVSALASYFSIDRKLVEAAVNGNLAELVSGLTVYWGDVDYNNPPSNLDSAAPGSTASAANPFFTEVTVGGLPDSRWYKYTNFFDYPGTTQGYLRLYRYSGNGTIAWVGYAPENVYNDQQIVISRGSFVVDFDGDEGEPFINGTDKSFPSVYSSTHSFDHDAIVYGDRSGTSCDSHTASGCEGGYICQGGYCTESCTNTNECNFIGGYYCSDGSCINTCSSDADCPRNGACEGGTCSEGDENETTECGPTTAAAYDYTPCPTGYFCEAGYCNQVVCNDDTDCYGIWETVGTCVGGYCRYADCEDNGDCYAIASAHCNTTAGVCVNRHREEYDCDNGMDDDHDGEADCLDNWCAINAICTTGSCSSIQDCQNGYVCTDGECLRETISRCSYRAHCMTNYMCIDGYCVEQGTGNQECSSNNDCHDGYTCQNSVCRALSTCSVDEECMEGFECQSNVCTLVSSAECQDDYDCPYSGYYCSSGICQPLLEDSCRYVFINNGWEESTENCDNKTSSCVYNGFGCDGTLDDCSDVSNQSMCTGLSGYGCYWDTYTNTCTDTDPVPEGCCTYVYTLNEWTESEENCDNKTTSCVWNGVRCVGDLSNCSDIIDQTLCESMYVMTCYWNSWESVCSDTEPIPPEEPPPV